MFLFRVKGAQKCEKIAVQLFCAIHPTMCWLDSRSSIHPHCRTYTVIQLRTLNNVLKILKPTNCLRFYENYNLIRQRFLCVLPIQRTHLRISISNITVFYQLNTLMIYTYQALPSKLCRYYFIKPPRKRGCV